MTNLGLHTVHKQWKTSYYDKGIASLVETKFV